MEISVGNGSGTGVVDDWIHVVEFHEATADKALYDMDVLHAVDDLIIVDDWSFIPGVNEVISVTIFCTQWLYRAFGVKLPEQIDNEKVIKSDIHRATILRDEVLAIADSKDLDRPLTDYIETFTDVEIKTVYHGDEVTVVEQKRKTRTRISKGNRSFFAVALANVARVKFGTIVYNEANMLMVRRWLGKVMEEPLYKDLRNVDKALALDRAMFLTFVVSPEYKQFKVLFDSTKMKDRLLMRFGAPQ